MSQDNARPRHTRIAVIYDNKVRPDTTGEYCRRALEAMGYLVSHYLPTEVEAIPPVYNLYLRVDDDLEYELPGDLRPLAYWAIDTHRDYAVRAARARAADVAFCAQRNGAARMRADGIGAAWLPLACDPAVHRRLPGVAKAYDVAFVGNLFQGDGDRTRLVEWIRGTYPRAFVGQAYGEEMARIYSAARVVFNCPIRDDVNMRVFEAVACGSLLLTRDLANNGQDVLFTPDEHLAVYRGDAELHERLAYYLTHADEQERIAEAGMRQAHTRHTYQHRMQDLLQAALEGASLEEKYPVASHEPRAESRATARGQREPGVERHEPIAASHEPVAERREPAAPLRIPADGRPLASIIIPTFKQRVMTERCVASIRGTTTLPYEILIVDNGSDDGTAGWARGQGLRVIANAENRGFPAACNQGIQAADGHYLLLLNNDTVVSPGWLHGLLAHAVVDSTIGLVAPSTNFAGNCQRIEASYGSHEEFLRFAERLTRERAGQAEEVDVLIGLCLLIPRFIVRNVGLLDERFGLGNFEDVDYSLRVRMAGYRLLCARDVFIHHEGHTSFRQLGEGFGDLLERNERRYRKKWDLACYRVRDGVVERAPQQATPVADQAPAATGQAWELLGAGQYTDAYAAFEALVLGQPANLQHLLGLGISAEGRGAPEAAALAYRGILAMAPGHAEASRGLARVAGGGGARVG